MDISNRITRYTDLRNNDSLSSYMGYTAQQSHYAYQVFYNFIEKTKPARILEIGTALGGFTDFLLLTCNELELKTKILSYDVIEKPWYHEMIKKGIDVRVENIFNEDYTTCKNEILDFIKEPGTTIVLCDGGNKIKEFNLLSNYIKDGDFILAHDYCDDLLKFEKDIKDKIWNWCEITHSDIKESIIKNNLTHYQKNDFDNAVWVCTQKKYEQNNISNGFVEYWKRLFV